MLLQGNRLIILNVSGRIEQNEPLFPRQSEQELHGLRLSLQLRSVTEFECLPSVGIVSEPLTQLIAGSDLAQPVIRLERLLGDAPWPKRRSTSTRTPSLGSTGS